MFSLRSAIKIYFQDTSMGGTPYFEPEDGGRLWVHDALHTLLNAKPNYRDEQIVGIYQAVLLNSSRVLRVGGTPIPEATPLTLEDIKAAIIPGIDSFITELSKEFKFRINSKNRLSDAEIETHFEKAKIFSILVNERINSPLGRFNIDRFLETPADDLTGLVNLSTQLTRGSAYTPQRPRSLQH